MLCFCYAPWSNINITPSGVIKPCCKFISNDIFNINQHTLDDYLNSNFLSQIKSQFLNNEKPKQCQRCWKEENNGVQSKRLLDLSRWQSSYSTYNFKDILTMSVAVGNICNLKCRICDSNSSSKWAKEEQIYIGTSNKTHDFFKNSKFISQLIPYLDNVIHLDIPGGEPFVASIDKHLILLDTIINKNRANKVSLHYTTNLTVFPEKQLWLRWQHFKNVDIQVSIDGIENQFEYNRFPAKWSECYANLKQYQEITHDNTQLSISHTLSVFTIFYLPEFVNWCVNEGLPDPWIGRLNTPVFYQPGIFPDYAKEIIKNKLDSHPSVIVNQWADEVFLHDTQQYINDFYKWTNIVDAYRNQNFNRTFPDLINLL